MPTKRMKQSPSNEKMLVNKTSTMTQEFTNQPDDLDSTNLFESIYERRTSKRDAKL